MKKILFLFLTVCLFAGTALATEFSADTVMTHREGMKMTGKMYFKADKFRMDMKSPQAMTTITRVDKNLMWNIMHDQKMYMEMPMDLRNKPMVEEQFDGEIERTEVGSETIDGHPTKKYLITVKTDDTVQKVYQWWATDIHFPVKTAAFDGSWTQEFKNVSLEKQPDSLFEVPSGYRKFQMPGGIDMRMMGMP
jgi:hypothetical protein